MIIGGGVNGTGIAYNLAKKGFTDVVVVEKGYLGSGASGRSGGGIRQQWSTEENIKLAMKSTKMFEGLANELDTDVDFVQGGYLVLAFTDEEVEQFEKNVILQNRLGLETEFITPKEAKEIVPELDVTRVKAATYNPTDGTLYPFPVIYGYARAARQMGVEFMEHTEVKNIVTEGNDIVSVKTDRGTIETDTVVNAAGGWSAEIALMAGVELPNRPYRHEIMVTEPFEHFLDPMVISFHHGIYFNQAAHGNIVGGIGNPNESPGINQRSSLWFIRTMAKVLVEYIPAMAGVNMIRQWAGLYDTTPDAQPILGPVPGLERFFQANGFSGHGFMVSPMVDKVTAELVCGEKPSMDIERLSVTRFEGMDLDKEYSVVG